MDELVDNYFVINELFMRDYYKLVVKVNNEVVDYQLNQITNDKIELILKNKPIFDSNISIILSNEIYESKKHIKVLYVLGLLVSILGAPQIGLLGNPLTHICEFSYTGMKELEYRNGIFIDCKGSVIKSWLECNEKNYKSWLFIMGCLTNLFCLAIAILLFMISRSVELFPILIFIILFFNYILLLYSKHIKKHVK